MKRKPVHCGKDALIDIIVEGYKIGIGPGKLGELTGYSERTVRIYAEQLDLTFGQGYRSHVPNPVPARFLIALAKAGIKWSSSETVASE